MTAVVAHIETVQTVADKQANDADAEHTESENELSEPTHVDACVGTDSTVVGVNAGEVAIDLLHIIGDIRQTVLDLGTVATELNASTEIGRNRLRVFLQPLDRTGVVHEDSQHTCGGNRSRRKRPDYNFD